MAKKRIILQALVALVVVWLVVLGVRAIAGSKRVTADKLAKEIEELQMEDWSEGIPSGASFGDRDEEIRSVAELYNGLDFDERAKTRERDIGSNFFGNLSPREKEQFVSLTVEKTMETYIVALDAMTPEQRRQIVEQGLSEVESGKTEENMREAADYGEGMLEQISQKGMKAYFENASVDTKLDLAPLIQAMDEVMKGLRGEGVVK